MSDKFDLNYEIGKLKKSTTDCLSKEIWAVLEDLDIIRSMSTRFTNQRKGTTTD